MKNTRHVNVAILWTRTHVGRRKKGQPKETMSRTIGRERETTLASHHGLTQPQRETEKDGGNMFIAHFSRCRDGVKSSKFFHFEQEPVLYMIDQ